MSLEHYIDDFRNLNVNRRREHASPHKVCLLLAVADLIETGEADDNQFSFDEVLLEAYNRQFERLQTESDQPNPQLPYYHLKSSGFWHHKLKVGQQSVYDDLASSVSQRRIRDSISYAYLDGELFEYLRYSATRELLKYELYANVDDKLREDYQSGQQGWSRLECELATADYLNMLLKELSDESFIKSNHRKDLRPFLNGRSDGSLEYKYQNISAILIELGLPYIRGYKPAFNYQKLLYDVVVSQVSGRFDKIQSGTEAIIVDAPEPKPVINWQGVHEDAPEVIRDKKDQGLRAYKPRIYNFSEREAHNRRLGERGEAFVLEYEKYRLKSLGRSDLANEIQWTSKVKGDGAGYDIRSFHGERDDELYIEVKTTNSGKYQPFYISDNEVAFSEENPNRYSLYRVFEFRNQPKLFKLDGSINQHVVLTAKQYQAGFK